MDSVFVWTLDTILTAVLLGLFALVGLAFGANHSAAERDIALYSLALSCVRAVRAMEERKVQRVEDMTSAYTMTPGMRWRWSAFDAEGSQFWGTTPLDAILTALREPPHAE